MAKPTVIVVGADKGGVGKTTVARTLLDYFTAHQMATRAFDTEAPKGTHSPNAAARRVWPARCWGQCLTRLALRPLTPPQRNCSRICQASRSRCRQTPMTPKG